MHIVARGREGIKVVCGTAHEVRPFVGVNDSGKTLRIGIGLLSMGKTEITVAFQSFSEDSSDTCVAMRAMGILEEIKWVNGKTLETCILASGDWNVPAELFAELCEHAYDPIEVEYALNRVFRVQGEVHSSLVKEVERLMETK